MWHRGLARWAAHPLDGAAATASRRCPPGVACAPSTASVMSAPILVLPSFVAPRARRSRRGEVSPQAEGPRFVRCRKRTVRLFRPPAYTAHRGPPGAQGARSRDPTSAIRAPTASGGCPAAASGGSAVLTQLEFARCRGPLRAPTPVPISFTYGEHGFLVSRFPTGSPRGCASGATHGGRLDSPRTAAHHGFEAAGRRHLTAILRAWRGRPVFGTASHSGSSFALPALTTGTGAHPGLAAGCGLRASSTRAAMAGAHARTRPDRFFARPQRVFRSRTELEGNLLLGNDYGLLDSRESVVLASAPGFVRADSPSTRGPQSRYPAESRRPECCAPSSRMCSSVDHDEYVGLHEPS
jgi:hypothetical protein